MKRFFLTLLMLNISNITLSQVYTDEINVGIENNVSVETNILVEDKSVEAVNAYWSQKRHSEAIAAIQEARTARISRWVDKPFSESLSQYKYLILLPPRKHHKDIKRNLKKKMKGLPIEYVNVQEPYKTHNKFPEAVRKNPEQVLYLTVDLRAPYLVETYMQIYDSYGKLIYSMGKEAMAASPAFKILRNELDFAMMY